MIKNAHAGISHDGPEVLAHLQMFGVKMAFSHKAANFSLSFSGARRLSEDGELYYAKGFGYSTGL